VAPALTFLLSSSAAPCLIFHTVSLFYYAGKMTVAGARSGRAGSVCRDYDRGLFSGQVCIGGSSGDIGAWSWFAAHIAKPGSESTMNPRLVGAVHPRKLLFFALQLKNKDCMMKKP
jgi:hypothetical protein